MQTCLVTWTQSAHKFFWGEVGHYLRLNQVKLDLQLATFDLRLVKKHECIKCHYINQ